MKALVYTKADEVVYRDEPDPVPDEGQVLVKVAASGICGSDMHAYHGHDPRRGPRLILGHEMAGTGYLRGNKVRACDQSAHHMRHLHLLRKRPNESLRQAGTYWHAGCRGIQRVCGGTRTESGSRPRFLRHGERLSRGTGGLFSPPTPNRTRLQSPRPLADLRTLVIGGGAIGLLSALLLTSYGCRQGDGGRNQQAAAGDGCALDRMRGP